MPDWKALVRKSLKDLRLSERELEEICAEMCSYLEDRYEELLGTEVSESIAQDLCLEEFNELCGVKRSIERAKSRENVMNRRTRTLWLPGFVSMAATSVLMMVLEYLMFFRPYLNPTNQVNLAYMSWLALLPFCGGVGAMLARRGDATIGTRVVAGLFPALTMLSVFLLIIPLDLLMNRNGYIVSHPLIMLQMICRWVLVPGVALLIGTLPFCRRVVQPAVPGN